MMRDWGWAAAIGIVLVVAYLGLDNGIRAGYRRERLADALAAGDPASVRRFEAQYAKLPPSQRAWVVFDCMSRCPAPAALRLMDGYLRDKDVSAWNRKNVADAARRPEFVPLLEGLLGDPDDDVRAAAACSLAHLTGKRYPFKQTAETSQRLVYCDKWSSAAER